MVEQKQESDSGTRPKSPSLSRSNHQNPPTGTPSKSHVPSTNSHHNNSTESNSLNTNNGTNESQTTSQDANGATTSSKKKKRRNRKPKQKNGTPSQNEEHTDTIAAVPDPVTPVIPQNVNSNPKELPNGQNGQVESKSNLRTTLNGHKTTLSHIPENDQLTYTKPVKMSPRRQAIMRYKTSDENITGRSYINEVKDNLKSKVIHSEDEGIKVFDEKENLDERVTLFKYKASKIFVYDEQMSDGNTAPSNSSGRLLGHGEFEIFQLHNGDVTYLSCGSSFIYPLLPKLKILRIDFNQFILPLVNPERYWKIIINSDEPNVIDVLGNTLDRVVKYRNLYFGSVPTQTKDLQESLTSLDIIPDILTINEQPTELKSLSIIDETESNAPHDFEFRQLVGEIPESPPSAPMSPHNDGFSEFSPLTPTKNLHSGQAWQLNRKVSDQSISSAMACLDITEHNPKKFIHQPKPNRVEYSERLLESPQKKKQVDQFNHTRDHNKLLYSFAEVERPYVHGSKQFDEKSDSSMDSLLDEYEDNITKSVYARSRQPSRPPSRQQSVISKSHYSRDILPNELEEFPSTSLSEYNKVHNNHSHHGPHLHGSRRSSRSELYVPESNWMEPLGESRIPKTRSSYSINSANHGNKNADLNSTYRNIYRSITQRNLNQILDDDQVSSKSHQPRLSTIQANSRSDFNTFRAPRRNSVAYSVRSERPASKNDLGPDLKLNSSDVYKIISRGKTKQNQATKIDTTQSSKGIASRLFGW